MKVSLSVEGFGKIEKANIDISNYTIFVGENNSGKTYMMHLIYGVLKWLTHAEFPELENYMRMGEEVLLNTQTLQHVVEVVNQGLRENQGQIVESIFHAAVPIKTVRFEVEFDNEEVRIDISKEKFSEAALGFMTDDDDVRKVNWMNLTMIRNGERRRSQGMGIVVRKHSSENEYRKTMVGCFICFLFGLSYGQQDIIYLPASRTGLLSLYKYFFAEKSRADLIREDMRYIQNELGLTEPVYDFLQFLLRYNYSDRQSKQNEELLDFMDRYLIDGHLLQMSESVVYQSEDQSVNIPLYLASSMVNELTPMIKILSGTVQYRMILYDEIETCLHPLKQQQMARLLNRLNNQGYRLIVSTHSDTMAIKLNNLFLLSQGLQKDSGRLHELQLERQDLLESDDVHAYQFKIRKDGKSEVLELDFNRAANTGYDFDLFTQSTMHLYNDVKVIAKDTGYIDDNK